MTSDLFRKMDKLDFELRISFSASTKISELSREFSISAAAGLLFRERTAEFTYFFPENAEQSRELGIFLRQLDAVKSGDVWKIKVEENSSSNYVTLIKDIIAVNSVAFTSLWLTEGNHRAGFVFHHSEIKQISDILVHRMSGVEGFSLEYLGPSEGFVEIFSRIDQKIGLHVAVVDLVAPRIELIENNNPMRNNWIRIVKLPYGSEDVLGIFIPSEIPAQIERVHTIVKGELYGAKTGNEYLNYMNYEKNAKRVIGLGSFHTLKIPILRVLEFVPTTLANDWLTIFYSSVGEMQKWKPVLSYFSDYGRWVEYSQNVPDIIDQKKKKKECGTLSHCAILSIKGLLPPVTKANYPRGRKSDARFHLIFNEKGKWHFCQNIGQKLSELEYESAKKYVSTWGGGEQLSFQDGILRVETPRLLLSLIEKVTASHGCRIVPDILQVGEDINICVEYHSSKIKTVNNLISEFLLEESYFSKELTYIGERISNYPLLIRDYEDLGNNLNDFSVIETVWKPTREQLETDVMGVFQNDGVFIPKKFTDSRENVMVAKLSSLDIKGKSKYTIVDRKNKIVEFAIETRFFTDFASEVIERYSGPVFDSLTVKDGKITNYYVVEKEVEQLFVHGLTEHWKKSARAGHKNYITKIKGLSDWAKTNSLPY